MKKKNIIVISYALRNNDGINKNKKIDKLMSMRK